MATQLTNEASIPQILAEMTPEEKMLLLTGSTGCDHRNIYRICHGPGKLYVIPFLGSVPVHAG